MSKATRWTITLIMALALASLACQTIMGLIDSSSFVRVTQDNDVFGMKSIERIRTQYGELRMVESLWCPTSKAYILDSSKLGLYTLRPFGWRPNGNDGDRDTAELVGEFSFVVANDKAHGYVSGITT